MNAATAETLAWAGKEAAGAVDTDLQEKMACL